MPTILATNPDVGMLPADSPTTTTGRRSLPRAEIPAEAAPPPALTPTAEVSRSMWRERGYRLCALLLAGDWIAASFAILAALQLREWQRAGNVLGGHSGWMLHPELLLFSLAGATLFVWLMAASKTYELGHIYRTPRWAANLLKSAIVWAVLLWAYLGVFPRDYSPRIGVLYCVIALVGVVFLWRLAAFLVLVHPAIKGSATSRVIVVGWSAKADQLRRAMRRDLAELSEIIGCVPSPRGRFHSKPPADVAVLGSFDALQRLVAECEANAIILADGECAPRSIQQLIAFCQREMLGFKMVMEYFPALNAGLRIQRYSGVSLLGVTRLPLERTVNRLIKRTMDIVGATIGLALSAPIMAIFALLVRAESPGPVIYRQRRMSRSGRNFTIYKIRSMRMDAEADSGAVWCTHHDPRRLKIGAFMRKYNIDELPQFWNVLKGDMSLVGPRPERPELIEKFKDEIPNYNARHEVRTGLTGWAQIHGLRGDTDLCKRVEADLYYLEHWSPLLDLYCLVATVFSTKNAH